MRRVLFGIDSFFQFVIATNLRTTVYKNDFVGIVIYSSTPSARGLYENLVRKGVYNEVYYANSSLAKCGKQYSKTEQFPKYFVYLWSLFCPQIVLNQIIGRKIKTKYDEFIFNGFGALPECIFNACYKKNNFISCKRIEDAYSSYFTVYNSKKGKVRNVIEWLSEKLLSRKEIDKFVDGYYFSEPDMVMADIPYPILSTPKFSRENQTLVKLLNSIFEYYPADGIKKKVILFEDGLCFFENRNDEVKIIEYVSSFISPKDILVKMHPRRQESRYTNFGIEAMKASRVPWEVIQLNHDYSGCIFLTFTSSAVFSSDVYFGDKCYKILLYKCLKGKSTFIDAKFEAYVRKYKERFGSEYLFIPESYEELKDILLKLTAK